MSNVRGIEVLQQGTAFDAFGRLRVSEPYTIFDSKLVNDKQPLFYDEVINGTATSTHNTGEASVSMTVNANGDYVIRETFMTFNYQPGKSQYILLTGVINEPTTNLETRIGYFNTSTTAPYTANRDGVYFGTDGTDKYVAISRNGTENKITQANWNVDKLDGTGVSGITLDWDENQIFFIDFEWLGVGIVRFGMIIDGVFHVCHIESHVNDATVATGAFMQTPNHSVRYEIRSTGAVATMKQICSSVMSEGGIEESGVTRGVSNGTTAVSVGTTTTGILFWRLNSGRPCTTVALDSFSFLNTANNTNNYRWAIYRNPTIAGTAPTYTQETSSAIDVAPGVSGNTLTNGTILGQGYASGSTPAINFSTNTLINPGIAIDGTQDEFCLAIQTFSGTDTFVGSANLLEVTCG